MKQSKGTNYKKQLHRMGVIPKRTVDAIGRRVWLVDGKEYQTMSQIANAYKLEG